MTIERRAFLGTAAAAPLIFGLRELLSQEPKWEPDWYAQARRRMKESGRLGVVLVVPDDKAGRDRLGAALETLLQDESEGPREVFCETVFVCVTSEIARACVRQPGERQNRFLHSPDGKRLAADSVEPAVFEDPAEFLKSFGALLHGDCGERLRERAAAIRAGLSKDVASAFDRLDAETVEERDEAAKLLQKEADRIAPLLVETRVTTANEETRARCRAILRKHFETAAQPGPRLPYGCSLEKARPVGSDCGACGLVIVREDARTLLRFLTK